jgi:hypothetical protein
VSGVWVRGAAIRPVPKYAIIDRGVLNRIESELANSSPPESSSSAAEGGDEPDIANRYFQEFEKSQPDLSRHVADVLSRRLDATAISLGYFLTLALWLAFHRTFGERLGRVTSDAIQAHGAALDLERTLRAERAHDPLELEDILQQEQPAIMAFVHLHVEVALDPESEGDNDVDVDDVHLVYETILVLTLALSHAVEAPNASAKGSTEILA